MSSSCVRSRRKHLGKEKQQLIQPRICDSSAAVVEGALEPSFSFLPHPEVCVRTQAEQADKYINIKSLKKVAFITYSNRHILNHQGAKIFSDIIKFSALKSKLFKEQDIEQIRLGAGHIGDAIALIRIKDGDGYAQPAQGRNTHTKTSRGRRKKIKKFIIIKRPLPYGPSAHAIKFSDQKISLSPACGSGVHKPTDLRNSYNIKSATHLQAAVPNYNSSKTTCLTSRAGWRTVLTHSSPARNTPPCLGSLQGAEALALHNEKEGLGTLEGEEERQLFKVEAVRKWLLKQEEHRERSFISPQLDLDKGAGRPAFAVGGANIVEAGWAGGLEANALSPASLNTTNVNPHSPLGWVGGLRHTHTLG